METATIVWLILGFISVIVLIYSFAVGMNIIWYGLMIGFLIGLGVSLKSYYNGMAVDWLLFLKGAVVGSIAGTIVSFFKRN